MHSVDNEESLPSWATELLAILRRRSPLLTWRMMRAVSQGDAFVGIPPRERFSVRATLKLPAAELPLSMVLPVVESAVAQVGIETYAGIVLHEMAQAIGDAIVNPQLAPAS